ncbi:MAG TPA: hypothetical protein VFL64_17445 [Rhizobacter sp.]|nr:hypothetical protein [Rhizobacter sp.]
MNTLRFDRLARLAALGLLPLALAAQAQTSTPAPAAGDDRGFSFFMGMGAQRLTYRETPSILPVESEARVTNPLLITGAVYAVTPDVLFALDAESTFAPRTVTEEWTATASSIGGVPVNNPLLQTNRFSLQETKTKLLGHYRLSGAWFALGGASFQTQSFKRYGFAAGPDNIVALPADRTVEESASEVLLLGGVALESERVRNTGSHYSVRATVGVPVWRRLENTAFPNYSFDGTKGYDLALAGRYSWAVVPNVHVGLWGQWSYAERDSQVQGSVELPKATLSGLAAGIEFLWKL